MSEEEHETKLLGVLQIIQQKGMMLKIEKCKIKRSEVTYLGHRINADGIKPKESLVDTNLRIPDRKNKDQLQSFMGLTEYYSKFVDHYSDRTENMRNLMCKGIQFDWSEECKREFEMIKS
ncbi:uncharacterized protein [Ambystoma mexicanum]|uniref:uncharacterized protein n=1 Tax=Ambystoma mexicanum TaxID=8296 RepID=UPI0037E94DBD